MQREPINENGFRNTVSAIKIEYIQYTDFPATEVPEAGLSGSKLKLGRYRRCNYAFERSQKPPSTINLAGINLP